MGNGVLTAEYLTQFKTAIFRARLERLTALLVGYPTTDTKSALKTP